MKATIKNLWNTYR